ncbi:hypothetical protein ACFLYY_00630 [Patescibacteria group bacterium]
MKRLSRGQRKHVRKEKARIRRSFSNKEEQIKLIDELYKKFIPSNLNKENENTRSLQPSNK